MVEYINIVLEGIKKQYDRPVLKNICLNVTNDSYVTIVGKSGSGKSRNVNIGFIFQSYNLIPTLTCRENIMLPMQYSHKKPSDLNEIIRSLDIVDLLDKRVVLLSGGEKQRVAIARALLLNPSLIIADEPTGNLDRFNTQIVLDLLESENEKGRAIIMITHDEAIAKRSKQVFRLENGVLNENS